MFPQMDPLSFDFRLDDFDLSLLPVDAESLKANADIMRSTLEKHLWEVFNRLPGDKRITHHDEHISVTWIPETSRDMEPVIDLVTSLLQRRAFGEAETVLKALLSRYPDDRRVLFNLGILLCEQGRLQDARGVLIRLTRTAPDFADAWNALGVTLSREGKRKDASIAFKKSLVLNPKNGYTLRNLGALTARTDPQEALRYLKQAAKLLPSDQAAHYTYAKALIDTGSPEDAVSVLKKAIALNERSEIADLCREARIKNLRRKMKAAVPRGLRVEVVVFCLVALETFKEIGRERTQAVTFELASVGISGLNLRDRTSRFRLQSLPGEFTALQLVVTMYVALKKTSPGADPGIDFSKEYAFALARLAGKNTKCRLRKSM